jgi:hypothetical protein
VAQSNVFGMTFVMVPEPSTSYPESIMTAEPFAATFMWAPTAILQQVIQATSTNPTGAADLDESDAVIYFGMCQCLTCRAYHGIWHYHLMKPFWRFVPTRKLLYLMFPRYFSM